MEIPGNDEGGIGSITRGCREIYQQVAEFYECTRPRIKYPQGYKILYGPPVHRPPIFFIGIHPGGHSSEVNERETWPSESDYAVKTWNLATVMRAMFDELDPHLLARYVGTNAIFFRSPDTDATADANPKSARSEIQNFCRPLVERMVNLMEPQLVVFIGFTAQALMKAPTRDGDSILRSCESSGRDLARPCSLGKYPAVSCYYLSTRRRPLTSTERKQIAGYIVSKIS